MCPIGRSGGATPNSMLRTACDRLVGVADADALDARCVARRGDAFADRDPRFGVDDVDGILPFLLLPFFLFLLPRSPTFEISTERIRYSPGFYRGRWRRVCRSECRSE